MSADEDPLAPYNYALDPACIAQAPTPERDGARLLTLDRRTGALAHHTIRDLPALLAPGDLLVLNETRVLPARLRGHKESGGAVEALLLGALPSSRNETLRLRALVRGRTHVGTKLRFERNAQHVVAEIVTKDDDGTVTLAFPPGASPYALGEMPLPPYIRRERALAEDDERYQTVFARVPGSVAAPTAGLHLSERLLAALDARGVARASVVLHVGAGTFRPLREADLAAGRLHAEHFELSPETAAAVARTRARGGRVVAIGTTAARVLETCAAAERRVEARSGETEIFLRPGSPLHVVDVLLTNFHLPRSSLLLLVAAFAGRDPVLAAYAEAQRSGYRFYSYGDAMLIR